LVLQKSYFSHFVQDDIQSFRLSGGGWLAALPPTNLHPRKFNVIHCHSERSEEYNNFYRTTVVINNKYLKPANFKKFYIENGNIVWGKNWDLMIPIENLFAE
jgi:exopolysaccharide biosynthesis protein